MSSIAADTREIIEIPLTQIRVEEGFNARVGADATVDQLATSIQHRGILTPLIVNEDANDDAYVLVAGHRRLAAATKVGLETVPCEIRAGDDADVDAAVENIAREQLSPNEEATAIERLFTAGYTAGGAADVLGIPKVRVTNRSRLLELPAEIRALWGPDGQVPPAGIDPMLAVHKANPEIAAKIAGALGDEDGEHWARRWAREPGDVFRQLVWREPGVVQGGASYHPDEDELDDETRPLYEQLKANLPPYSYNGPAVYVSQDDVDAAYAHGCAVTLGRSTWILDADFVKGRLPLMLQREVDRQEAEKVRAAEEKAAAKKKAKAPAGPDDAPETPDKVEARLRRELTKRAKAEAPAVNERLGATLLDKLSTVDVTIDVARVFVYGMFGRPSMGVGMGYDRSRMAELALAGVRYCFADLRHVELTGKNKDREKTVYAGWEEAEKWAWAWLDKATEPGDLFGRALVLLAAGEWAISTGLVPRQEEGRSPWSDYATSEKYRKAFAKATKSAVPPAVKRLRRELVRDVYSEPEVRLARWRVEVWNGQPPGQLKCPVCGERQTLRPVDGEENAWICATEGCDFAAAQAPNPDRVELRGALEQEAAVSDACVEGAHDECDDPVDCTCLCHEGDVPEGTPATDDLVDDEPVA